MRPVAMAAFTTVLGMLPLIFDAFFAAMAVTIMFGLTFACVLTLIVVPVLYTMFYRIAPRKVGHITLAHARGLGRMDVENLNVQRIVV